MTTDHSAELREHVDAVKVKIERITRRHDKHVQVQALANALCNAWYCAHGESLDGLAVWFADHIAVLAEALADGRIKRRPIR